MVSNKKDTIIYMERINNLISVIIPVYKVAWIIEKTIESVQKQTYQNLEIVLVDDCSPDNSADIINQMMLKDERIRYFKLEENSGAAVARNRAIRESRGRYIAFLDSDDMWEPDKLEKELTLMKEKKCGFVYSAIKMIDKDGNVTKESTYVPQRLSYKTILTRTYIATSSVLLDITKIGEFQMPLRRSGQDYATWLMLLRRIDYAYGVQEPLVRYRNSPNSLSSNKIASLKKVFSVQTKFEGINPIYATFNTFCFGLYAFKKHFL